MRTHCRRGHQYTEENTYAESTGRKECRACRKIARKKYRQSKPWVASFRTAKERCCDKKRKNYYRYGGRGIKFLMTMEDFKNLWFRDKAYLMKTPSIDRKDNNGNYEINNCRFIESSENSRRANQGESNHGSKLNNIIVFEIRRLSLNGKKTTALARKFNVDLSHIRKIINRKRWKHI